MRRQAWRLLDTAGGMALGLLVAALLGMHAPWLTLAGSATASGATLRQPTPVTAMTAVIVARMAAPLQVRDTASHTLITFTPAADGLYRVSFDAVSANTGGDIALHYTSAFTNTAASVDEYIGTPSGNVATLTGYAKAGTIITVTWQNAKAAPPPNDAVYAIVERVA